MEQTITVYQAIKEMREITARGGTFSFTHATYNRDTRKCTGLRQVKRASLRPAAKEEMVKHSNFKLFYFDHYFRENRNCWQPLIMFFNNKKVILT